LAVRAALSGHLVFSTIHTPDIAGIDRRFENLGIRRQLLSEVVVARVSQRLLRRVCSDCVRRRSVTRSERMLAAQVGVELSEVREGHGCGTCFGAGYRGRIGIFDVVTRRYMGPGLRSAAWTAVRTGMTTPAELAAVVGQIDVGEVPA
jgi:type II secretory ATPase GspE/PulE/Tfp pilus assembly ATPase PilB-like protein